MRFFNENFVPFFLIKCLSLADLTLERSCKHETNIHETSYFNQKMPFKRYNVAISTL